MRSCLQIAWIAVRELFYERVFYLFFSFALLSLYISILLGQMTYAEQTKLTIDFMLAGIEISMVLFSIFMGISLFQREITFGSVSMVLSKPISRSSFVIGKYFGQLFVQFLMIIAMSLITVAFCSRLDDVVSYKAIFQSVLLIFYEVSVLSALTYFFAANSGAITSAVASGVIFLCGHFMDTVTETIQKDETRSSFWSVIKHVFPDFEVFNMKALASYGITISWNEIGIATLYALVCVVMFLVLAVFSFNQKDILT
jgi:Cu-processing system permease protein